MVKSKKGFEVIQIPFLSLNTGYTIRNTSNCALQNQMLQVIL